MPPDYTCALLVRENQIDLYPFSALMSIMHEAGHEDEIKNGVVSTYSIGKNQTREGVALTEYSSTRLALKLAQDEYLRTGGDPAIIKHAVPQAALYNRVVYG